MARLGGHLSCPSTRQPPCGLQGLQTFVPTGLRVQVLCVQSLTGSTVMTVGTRRPPVLAAAASPLQALLSLDKEQGE